MKEPAHVIWREGPFKVLVKLLLLPDAVPVSDDINDWMQRWVDRHGVWSIKLFRGGSPVLQEKRFFDDFSEVPRVVAIESSHIIIELRCRQGSRFWRDWYVRLVSDLRASFPEIDRVEDVGYIRE